MISVCLYPRFSYRLLLLLHHYPTEQPRNLIAYLYDTIKPMLATNPEASWLFASRYLRPSLTGTDAIGALKVTNEGLLGATQNHTARMDSVYAG